ncbi:MAG TPA: XdhC family protein [Anaeromyxobacteraceae bacterium]|nr:XdhC family protein [Anaeromyxobacteraceae bacterium]
MRAELLQLAADLARRGEPFVLAVVVRREPYSSAHQGDMAVITADGGYHGWLGGNCTRPAVKREARRALADGQPRLVSLSPEASDRRPGVTALPMSCHSGGSVDIYLEPVLPVPRLLLFGPSPVVSALVRLGKAMGYLVDLVGPSADGPGDKAADRVYSDPQSAGLKDLPATSEHLFAVVATMGESDEDAIASALALEPAYLAVVASRKRFARVRETLLERGLPSAALDRIRNPAGLDLGARLPEEVALSIMAEVVQVRRAQAAALAQESAASSPGRLEDREETDPVCGMPVAVSTARHQAEHQGRAYYFCNARCREKFLLAPDRYLARAPAGGTG